MTVDELFQKIDGQVFEGLGIRAEWGKPMLVIKHKPTALVTQIPAEALAKLDWDLLEKVLVGEREPVVLQHMTRVVGYYSRIENWNESKIGELNDRHKGQYTLQEASA